MVTKRVASVSAFGVADEEEGAGTNRKVAKSAKPEEMSVVLPRATTVSRNPKSLPIFVTFAALRFKFRGACRGGHFA